MTVTEKHGNDIEIDFLISNKSKLKQRIFPIEVKSGKNYSTTSINSFAENYKDRIGASYIIHPKNFKLEDNKIIPQDEAFKKINSLGAGNVGKCH